MDDQYALHGLPGERVQRQHAEKEREPVHAANVDAGRQWRSNRNGCAGRKRSVAFNTIFTFGTECPLSSLLGQNDFTSINRKKEYELLLLFTQNKNNSLLRVAYFR